MDLFTLSWTALRTAAAGLPDSALTRPSGCRGWLVRDLLCHVVFDAQDVLITLSTPAETTPSADALSFWTPRPAPPEGSDPLGGLTVRLAAAYEDPALLRQHLENVGAAAGRAALLAHPDLPVSTRDMTLTVRDYLSAHVLEWTLHHLDLVAHLGDGEEATVDPPVGGPRADDPPAAGPPAEGLAAARDMVERRLRLRLPVAWTDADALRVATGRRPATPAERAELDALGPRGQMLPLSFG
ncbi:thioesterase [Brachybacterium avium]|uniref:Thioesterase n=1 Tax=Brachybacterium avium TaxID=2017485 RepID=A0A220UDE7_9MICO|nr:maleylpyruvate isomerase N-terminal domain-containing protein [Brachybacterium avium]ASK65932.1 thioesterase [Brachybacterium avium]